MKHIVEENVPYTPKNTVYRIERIYILNLLIWHVLLNFHYANFKQNFIN